ncbi:AMP-binding protein, partial [Nocardia sienata]|uniref:AMP-binding protein n=1 Tax=Nocardia sienata TaxID=248552 RepID=UPI001C3FA849
MPGLFENQAAAAPDAVAIVFEDQQISYRQVNARANRLARRLIGRGVGPESVVAVAVGRSPELVIALLAILKTGGAYLPIDPNYPSERTRFILTDAHPALVLTDTGTAAVLPPTGFEHVYLDTSGPEAAPDPGVAVDSGEMESFSGGRGETDPTDTDRIGPLRPEHLAYVIYTSGSTGTPKGVAISHRNVVNCVSRMSSTLDEGAPRVLASTSATFDVSVFEIFTPLCTGGSIEVVRDVLVLGEQDGWTGDVISTVPSVFVAMLDQIAAGAIAAGTIVFAGEALSAWMVERVQSAMPGVRMIDAYGPTETTVYATSGVVDPSDG